MSFMLSSYEIEEYLKKQEILTSEVKESCVYARAIATREKHLSWGSYQTDAKEAYFLTAINKNQILLAPVNRLTGKLDQDARPVTISLTDLTAIKMKQGRLMNSVQIIGAEEEIKLKISKIIVGMAWHDENMQHFMTKMEAFAAQLDNKTPNEKK